jgi:hypothetical protein
MVMMMMNDDVLESKTGGWTLTEFRNYCLFQNGVIVHDE